MEHVTVNFVLSGGGVDRLLHADRGWAGVCCSSGVRSAASLGAPCWKLVVTGRWCRAALVWCGVVREGTLVYGRPCWSTGEVTHQ